MQTAELRTCKQPSHKLANSRAINLQSAEDRFGRTDRLMEDLPERVTNGGYPRALARKSSRRAAAWYRNYVETLVQRDIPDLARIHDLDVVPRLLEAAAGQTALTASFGERLYAVPIRRLWENV